MADIVTMQPRHIDGIEEIERASFKTPWSRKMIEDELKNPLATYFVCENNGKVVAYMGYYRILDEAHITNIAVAEAYRRQGYGEKIFRFVLDDMRSKNVARATLEVNEHNLPAIALYEKNGFVLAGKRPCYYEGKDAALIYWRNIEGE